MLTWGEAELFLRSRTPMRRRAWPPFEYVSAQLSNEDAPDNPGEAVEWWQPTIDDLNANDWERA